jgi:hypothetical protein
MENNRIRTGGMKFKLTVQFLTPQFLQYLAEDISHVTETFDITPNAAKTLQKEVVNELEVLKVSSKRPLIKKLLGTI